MADRIKLSEDNFEEINYYHEKKDKIKISHQLKQQILADQEKVEKIEELDLEFIIQILKEYGFVLCSTSECRNKVALQHDKLKAILEKK